MTTKQDTIAINFTKKDLETIYIALNNLCCDYSDKSSTTMKKIKDGTLTPQEFCDPDYFFQEWERVGAIQNRIYAAEQELDARSADPIRSTLTAIFA